MGLGCWWKVKPPLMPEKTPHSAAWPPALGFPKSGGADLEVG